ncbi:MAG TPA: hypothetical protein VEH10_04795 [Thermoplasmata archaeon]|nr:hypothetical protein [Thermoplasmata archaeon]
MRRTNEATVAKRAVVVLHSYQGFSPPKIASMILSTPGPRSSA